MRSLGYLERDCQSILGPPTSLLLYIPLKVNLINGLDPEMASLLPTYHETLGAASVGFSLSCGVFGVLTTLLFIYFRRYPQDTVGYKALVSELYPEPNQPLERNWE